MGLQFSRLLATIGLPSMLRMWWSRLRADEGSSSSNFTQPDGIIQVNDAVYKLCDPRERLQVEIVFVHGLQSSHYRDAYWRTWRGGEKGNEICWPMEWLSEGLPGARIWSLSYDACALETSTTGRMDTFILGEGLVRSMVGLADIGQENCPIVFVCHCLGGLVVKEIVIQAHDRFGQDPKYESFLQNVRGFFFYATPHDGSILADLASYLPFGGRKSKLVEQLRVINDDLGRLNARFEQIEKDKFWGVWKFSVAAETHATIVHGFNAKVVEEASSRHGYNNFISIAADHFGVCAPTEKVDSSFLVVRKFVEDIMEDFNLRSYCLLEVPSLLVGMEERLEEVLRKLDTISSVGLVGMGGIGKTTLSKHFYNKERRKFEKSCFLEDVKSQDIKVSQMRLYRDLCGNLDGGEVSSFHLEQIKQCIRTKKVLLVVDDVGKEVNLKALCVDAFKGGCKGSRVIVTTRRHDVLNGYMDLEDIIDLECLKDVPALELFSHYAFDKLGEVEILELDGLSKDISKACGGLPLAIEVVGKVLGKYGDHSYVDGRKEVWEKALEKLQKAESLDGSHDDRLWARLKISYDDLDDNHKSMFLDFACILGERVIEKLDSIPYIWDGGMSLIVQRRYLGRIWGDEIGVDNLMKRSLVKWSIDRKALVMHDQLRDLGRSISKRTRIWNVDEGVELVREMKGLRTLEGFIVHGVVFRHLVEKELNLETHPIRVVEWFERLRLLNFRGQSLKVVRRLLALCSTELRWLCMNDTNISCRSIQDLGSFHKLRVLEVSWCSRLLELPESICNMSELMELDVSYCESLRSLPKAMGQLKALKILNLNGCEALEVIPRGVGRLPNLDSIKAKGCRSLDTLCKFGVEMHRMKELNFSGCQSIKTIRCLGNLCGLETLNLMYCPVLFIKNLGGHLKQLSRLRTLELAGCDRLYEEVAMTIGRRQLCTNLETLRLPIILEGESPVWPCLRELEMWNGFCITEFKIIASNLLHLETLILVDDGGFGSSLKVLPNALGNLEGLKNLKLSYLRVLERLPESLGSLHQLETLWLEDLEALAWLPDSLGNLLQLEHLTLSCESLTILPKSLGNLSRLKNLVLEGCSSLIILPESFGNLMLLTRLDLGDCKSLTILPKSLGNLLLLTELNLGDCESLTILPESLGNLSQLCFLRLIGCSALERLPESIGHLPQLQILVLHSKEWREVDKSILQHLEDIGCDIKLPAW